MITIKNKIQIDEDVELVHEAYPGEVVQKGDWLYLIYQNQESEKVVLKLKEDELIMTRFSQPQTQMRFVSGGLAPASVPTPMGVQRMVTRSKAYQLNQSAQQLKLAYDLLMSPEADLPLASYELEISWTE